MGHVQPGERLPSVPGGEPLRRAVVSRIPAEAAGAERAARRDRASGVGCAERSARAGAGYGLRRAGRHEAARGDPAAVAVEVHGHLSDAGEPGVPGSAHRPEQPARREHLLARGPNHRELRPAGAGADDDAARMAEHVVGAEQPGGPAGHDRARHDPDPDRLRGRRLRHLPVGAAGTAREERGGRTRRWWSCRSRTTT